MDINAENKLFHVHNAFNPVCIPLFRTHIPETETPADTSEAGSRTEPTGEEIQAYVTKETNYKNWELWPGTGELNAGKGPHRDLITIHVSDNALSAIEEKAGSMPDNSTIVKEGYNSKGELETVVVMHKVEGFDPEHNGWFWLGSDADGEIIAEGKVLSCYNCHARQANNDFC